MVAFLLKLLSCFILVGFFAIVGLLLVGRYPQGYEVLVLALIAAGWLDGRS